MFIGIFVENKLNYLASTYSYIDGGSCHNIGVDGRHPKLFLLLLWKMIGKKCLPF